MSKKKGFIIAGCVRRQPQSLAGLAGSCLGETRDQRLRMLCM